MKWAHGGRRGRRRRNLTVLVGGNNVLQLADLAMQPNDLVLFGFQHSFVGFKLLREGERLRLLFFEQFFLPEGNLGVHCGLSLPFLHICLKALNNFISLKIHEERKIIGWQLRIVETTGWLAINMDGKKEPCELLRRLLIMSPPAASRILVACEAVLQALAGVGQGFRIKIVKSLSNLTHRPSQIAPHSVLADSCHRW